MEPSFLHDGRLLFSHEEGSCRGEHCCLHNPSDHPLRTAPLDWSDEVGAMFRVCEHGHRHPDPDDVEFKMMTGQFLLVEALSTVHLDRCCGCCREAAPEVD